jgi:hypothetical protein
MSVAAALVVVSWNLMQGVAGAQTPSAAGKGRVASPAVLRSLGVSASRPAQGNGPRAHSAAATIAAAEATTFDFRASKVPHRVTKAASCPAPSAPGTVGATGGANQATITWLAAQGNGSTITAYVVRAASGPDTGASIATGGSATSAVLTGLAGGSAATFSVVAESSCGTGPSATSPAVTTTGATSTYVGTVLGASPTAFYRLGEASGTVMADSSGNDVDGTYSGQETLGTSPALASDPATSTGYTSCCTGIGSANPALPQFDSPRTVEAWVNTTDTTIMQALVDYGTSSPDEGFVLALTAQTIRVDASSDYIDFHTPRSIHDGAWHFVTATFDGTTVTAYLDGQPIGTGTFSGTVNTLNSGGLSLGSFPGYGLDARLADVAVYPSSLSAAQVAAEFSASGYGRPTAAKVAAATFGGTNGATVTWGRATAVNAAIQGYVVSALGGAHGSPSVAVSGTSTATRIFGLAPGNYTFQVVAYDSYGAGPAAKTKSFTVTGAASTYSSTVLSLGPSAFYRLGDSTPALMADSSGKGANGTYTPSVSTVGEAGPLPNDLTTAAFDNGVGNTPAAESNPVLPLYSSPRTVEAWVNTTYPNEVYLASYGTGAQGQGFSVDIAPHQVIASGYSDDLTFTSAQALDDGQWHFIAVTTDGVSAAAYVDGAPIGTQTFRQPLDTLPTLPGLLLGTGVQGCCNGFQGDLADLAVFPSALTAAQVSTQFSTSGLAPPPAPTPANATPGANQATVSWNAPSGSNPAVNGYLVTAVNGSARGPAVTVPAGASTAIVTGLAGGTPYTFDVQALNEYGAGAIATTPAITPTGTASTYASTVLSLGPSVFYRLADSPGVGAIADSSGNQATGSYNPLASDQLGQPGPLANDAAPALGDNGLSSPAVGNPSLPLFDQARTIEGWVNATVQGEMFVASYGTQSTGSGLQIGIEANAMVVSGYDDDLTFPSGPAIEDGHWHFISVTVGTFGLSATAYLDGVALGTQTFPQPLDTQPGSPGILVGDGVGGCCGSFTGDLADLAVFPFALSGPQVAAQFGASGLGVPPAPAPASAVTGVNRATISWQAPSANPPVTGYLVTALVGGSPGNAMSVSASSTSAILTGLAAGTSYTFEVQALNEYGAGPAATTAAVSPSGTASTYASSVLALGPSAFYRLGDSATAAMADSSGHGATGSYSTPASTLGQPGPLAGDPGSALGDSGQGPAARGNPSLPLYAQPRTVEGWVNTTSIQPEYLVGYGRAIGSNGFYVAIQPYDVVVSGDLDDTTFTSRVALDDGQWHFIAVTTNGVSATAYVDGVSLGSRKFPAPLNTLPSSGLYVGAGPQGCCNFLQGDLADLAVFPQALSAAQISAQFAASGLAVPPAPTQASAVAGVNQATVSWTGPSSSIPAVTAYLVTALKAGAAVNSVAVPASVTSTIVTGLAGGSSYTFEVQALDEYGTGAPTSTVAVTPTGSTSTYASTVLSLGPSVFYRLGDSTPAAMADSSGHAATGVYNASVATFGQAGPLGSDASTSVANTGFQAVSRSDPSLPLYGQSRTLEGWVKTTFSGEQAIAAYGTLSTGRGFSVAVLPGSVLVSGYEDDLTFAPTSAINDGNWHFIVVTTNGTSATAYVDSTSLGTQTFPQSLDTLATPQGLLVAGGLGGCCGLDGDLADLAVFPAALTSAQVSSQYSVGTAVRLRHYVYPTALPCPAPAGRACPADPQRPGYPAPLPRPVAAVAAAAAATRRPV